MSLLAISAPPDDNSRMQLAITPNAEFEAIQLALSSARQRYANGGNAETASSLAAKLKHALWAWRLSRAARCSEKAEKHVRDAYQLLSEQRKSQTGFYTRSHEKDLYAQLGALQAAVASLPSTDILESYFPKQAARIKIATKRLRELADSCLVLFPPERQEAIDESRRQYERGELVDFETFANDLQGIS